MDATLESPRESFDVLEVEDYRRARTFSGSEGDRKSSIINALPTSPMRAAHLKYHDNELNLFDWLKQSSLVVRLKRFINHHSRPDYVLCGIPKKNKWRKRVKALVNSIWFFGFISIMVILHFIVLALYVPYLNQDFEERNTILAYFNALFVLVYIIEAALRIFAAGFVLHRSSYMRKWNNVLDMFVILIGLISIAEVWVTTLRGVYEFMSCWMALRLLRILAYFRSVQFILRALGQSVLPLLHLGWFIFCVMMFFALIGLELDSSGDYLHHGCFVNYTDEFDSNKTVRVSDYPCGEHGSHKCDQVEGRSFCHYWDRGPNNGMVGFDNLAVAMLTVFQCMTLEGWTSVLYLYESSSVAVVAWIYAIAVIIFGSLLILNLFLGVLTSVFIGVSDRQEELGMTRALKEKRKLEEELRGYREWIRTAMEEEEASGGLITGGLSASTTGLTRSHSEKRPSAHSVEFLDNNSEDEAEINETLTIPSNRHWVFRFLRITRRRVWNLVKSHAFFWFMIIIIQLNLIVLLFDHYRAPLWLQRFIYNFNYFLTAIYILEVILKVFAMGVNNYFVSNFNKLSFILAIINILDILIFMHIRQIAIPISQIVNAVRALRLITVFKYTRYWHAMKAIVSAFTNIWSTMLSLLGLLGVYLVLVALLGMRLFRTRLTIPDLRHPNFNTFVDAVLLAFQLATTEDWHVVMYSTANSYLINPVGYPNNWLVGIFYVASIMIGGLCVVLLANIFLAIAVDKLLEVNEAEKDVTKRVEKMEEQRREREKQLTALKNPSEPSGLGRTLKKIVMLYSLSVSHEEDIKRRRRNQRRRSGSEIRSERHNSVPGMIDFEGRRRESSFSRAVSDPIKYNNGESEGPIPPPLRTSINAISGRLFPRKVSVKNPLRKAEESVELQAYTMRGGGGGGGVIRREAGRDIMSKRLDKTSSFISISDDFEEFDYFGKHRPSVSTNTSDPAYSDIFDGSDTASDYYRTPPLVHSKRMLNRQCSLESEASTLSSISSTISSTRPVVSSPAFNIEDTVLIPNSSPILKPGATPMVIPDIGNTVGGMDEAEDMTITRLAKQSSLEEVTTTIDQLSDEVVDEVNIVKQLKKAERRKKLKQCWDSFTARVSLVKQWAKAYFGSIELDPRNELSTIPAHSAFFVLAPDNRFRSWCFNLVRSKAFQSVAFTITVVSSLVLAVESPVPVKENLYCILQDTVLYFDLAVLVWFIIELFLKVISLGFIVHKGSYLRGLFNIIDFMIIIVTMIPLVVFFMNNDASLISCYSYSQQISSRSSVYTLVLVLRVARPIRIIRLTGLYLVCRGMILSLKRMGHIILIGVLCLLIFSIIGVQCFKGRFFYCSDFLTEHESECGGEYFTYNNAFDDTNDSDNPNCPLLVPRVWKKWRLNFDNIFLSMLTLFTMLTKEGWQDVMYNAIDSTGQDRGPKYGTSQESLIYFILYMIFVTFFLLNFIVGFIIVTFQRVGIKTYTDSGLDRNQLNCLYIALTAHYKKSYVPKNRVHKFLRSIITSKVFDNMIYILVFVNTAVLAIQHSQMSDGLRTSIYWINFGFTVIFTLEAILKLIILTPANYFRSVPRVFEFFVVIGSICELLLQQTTKIYSNDFMYSHIISAFRVLRLTLVSKNTRLVFWTVIRSIEIFPWIGVLLVLVLYMFAVGGMQIFGQIKVSSIDLEPITAIHQYNNFKDFFQAMKVMIRTFTGENWERIMLSCVNATCDKQIIELTNGTMSTCGSPAAYAFFPIFFILSSILVLNLFVAIIIENFDYYIRDKSILGSHHLRDFPILWAKFDHNRTGTLKHGTVITMMKLLEPPLGWGKLCSQMTAYKRMMRLNIPLLPDDTVSFNATLLAIVRHSLKINTSGNLTDDNMDLKNKLKSVFPNVPKKMLDSVIPERTDRTTGQLYGALVIQYHWRSTKISQQKLEQYKLQKRMSSLTIQQPSVGRELLLRRGTLAKLVARETQPNSPKLTTSNSSVAKAFNLPTVAEEEDGDDHEATPTAEVLSQRKRSQLTRLETIEETDDDDDVGVVSGVNPAHSMPSPEHRLVKLKSTAFSITSESDMFATPTGSLTSLHNDESAEINHTHSQESFKETLV